MGAPTTPKPDVARMRIAIVGAGESSNFAQVISLD